MNGLDKNKLAEFLGEYSVELYHSDCNQPLSGSILARFIVEAIESFEDKENCTINLED